MVLEVFVVFIISAAVCSTVGAVIDGQRGALWGFFLGPLGWIIAAILKKPEIVHPIAEFNQHSSRMGSFSTISKNAGDAVPALEVIKPDHGIDLRKWAVLKEVDPEVRAASDRVSELDPALDAILAEKYLILNQKVYLQSLTDLLITSHAAQQAQEMARTEQLGTAIFQSGQRQKIEYEKSLGADHFDRLLGSKVQSIDIYAGSWAVLRGGVYVSLLRMGAE